MIALLVVTALAGGGETCRPAADIDAKGLLRAAVERTGLAATGSRAMRVSGYDVQSHAYESDRMYPPPLIDATSIDQVFDPVTGVDRITSRTSLADQTIPAVTVLSDEGHAFAVRDSSIVPSESVHAAAWSTRPLNVWAVLDDWMAATDVHASIRCLYRDYWRAVLERQGPRGRERLYMDKKSGYPVKLDRLEPHYLWGQVHVEFVYSTWQLIDGVHLPGEAFRLVDGALDVTRVFGRVHLVPRDSVRVAVPAGPPMGFAPPRFLAQSNPDTIRVSDHTWLLHNAGYSEMVTLARDTVFVFDATQGDDRAHADAAWISKLFPGPHPIVLVVTDLAWPHVAGVRYWVAHGATIVSHRAARPFLEQVVARHWTLTTDTLERSGRPHVMTFRAVSDSARLAGGDILLFPIDGAASEVVLDAFVRPDRFLWASDYIQDLDHPTQYLDETWAAVQRVHVEPANVAAEHVALSPWARAAGLMTTGVTTN